MVILWYIECKEVLDILEWSNKLRNGYKKMICHGWTVVFGLGKKVMMEEIDNYQGRLLTVFVLKVVSIIEEVLNYNNFLIWKLNIKQTIMINQFLIRLIF
jgi:hypothetical protein